MNFFPCLEPRINWIFRIPLLISIGFRGTRAHLKSKIIAQDFPFPFLRPFWIERNAIYSYFHNPHLITCIYYIALLLCLFCYFSVYNPNDARITLNLSCVLVVAVHFMIRSSFIFLIKYGKKNLFELFSADYSATLMLFVVW